MTPACSPYPSPDTEPPAVARRAVSAPSFTAPLSRSCPRRVRQMWRSRAQLMALIVRRRASVALYTCQSRARRVTPAPDVSCASLSAVCDRRLCELAGSGPARRRPVGTARRKQHQRGTPNWCVRAEANTPARHGEPAVNPAPPPPPPPPLPRPSAMRRIVSVPLALPTHWRLMRRM